MAGQMMRGVVAFIVGVADLAGEIIARESISLRLANIAEHQAQLDGFCSRPIEGGNPIRVEVGQLLAALFEIEQARHDRNDARGAMVRRRVRAVANGARQRRRRDETRGRAFARVDDRSRL
jgi:hypothetical protein